MSEKNNRIFLFYVVTGMYFFSLYTYVPILSPYAESLGASYKLLGLIIGSYGFTQMILRIPLGILSDRFNRRKLFVILGVVLGLVSSLGMWYFRTAPMLMLFRSVAGAAAASWVAYTVLFSSYFKGEEAPKAMGFLSSAMMLGQVGAMFLGGIAAEHLSQQAPFLMASAGAMAGIILGFFVKEKREAQPRQVKIKVLLVAVREPGLILFSILAIFLQLMTFATVYSFTPIAAGLLGATPSQLGILATLSTLPGIPAAVLSGSFFARRFKERNVIICGFVISAIACAVVPYIGNIGLLYATQLVGGFSKGVIFPLLMGLSIRNINNDKRATSMGFFQAIYGLGMFLGPVIAGVISDSMGLTWGFGIIGLIGIMGACTAYVFMKRDE